MESEKCSKCGQAKLTDCRSVIEQFGKDRGNLIPILHALQDNLGFIGEDSAQEVAAWLSIPVSEVYGTATFYTLFAMEPKGKYMVRLCDSPPCHIEGSKAIRRAIERTLGVESGGTTQDGLFTFETVSCFGLCGVAPAIMVNDDVYGNLTPEAIPSILARYRKDGE